MTNNFFVPKAYIVMGLCLPLAVLLGYFVAEPADLGSLGIISLVLAGLSVPLLMKWYHPLLVFSCNSAFALAFLPGGAPLWLVATAMGAVFFVLNQSLNAKQPFMLGGSIPWSLLCLGVVVVLTALTTGGFGLRTVGSAQYGGKHYIFVLAGIAAYFVVATRPIPPTRAKLYGALFFLSFVTGALSIVAFFSGGKLYGLYYLLGADSLILQKFDPSDVFGDRMVRLGGLSALSSGGCLYLLFRYGAAGILDLGKAWRAGLMLLLLGLGLLGGFRSALLFILLVFGLLFFLEGLHRTRHLIRLALLGLVCCIGLGLFANKLPLSMQRAVSFLPIEVSQEAKADAEYSVNWRLEMWRALLPEVPQYLLKGKGYGLAREDLRFDNYNAYRGFSEQWRWAVNSSDFHNGPLSVLIPFGLWGMLAVIWFFIATGRMLYWNARYGAPELLMVNRMLLAFFLARVFFFIFLVGALNTDLPVLAILAGLGVSLNRRVSQPAEAEETEPALDWQPGREPERAGYRFDSYSLQASYRRQQES